MRLSHTRFLPQLLHSSLVYSFHSCNSPRPVILVNLQFLSFFCHRHGLKAVRWCYAWTCILWISVSVLPSPQTALPKYTKLSHWCSFFPSSLMSRSFFCCPTQSTSVFSRLTLSPCLPKISFQSTNRSWRSASLSNTTARSSTYINLWRMSLVLAFLLITSTTTTVGLGHSLSQVDIHPEFLQYSRSAHYSTFCLLICGFNHSHLHLWDTHPPQRSHGHISRNCVICLFKVYESQSHIILSFQFLFHQLSLSEHPIPN